MQWSDWVSALGAELAMSSLITAPTTLAPAPTVPDFNTILPRCVEFAELMMYRDPDLDFLAVRTFDSTGATTNGLRTLAIPAQIIVPLKLNLISPAGTTNPENGTRNPVQRASPEWIDMLYPAASTTTGLPIYFAITDNNQSTGIALQVRLGPTPNGAYTAEWYGQYRPAALTANTTTFLTANLPDLFLSASMIFMSGYQRNFGAQSDDPKMALSWQAVYEAQKKGAAVEEARRRAMSTGWTAYAPTPIATPPRM